MLLKLLSESRQMNLYYEVMHKIEFEHFEHGVIKGKILSKKQDVMKDLSCFLEQQTGISWNINVEFTSNIISTFDKLMQKLQNSDDWKMITKYFPDAEVKDIIKD